MAKTRETILDEALRLFASKGIRETTVRDIARAVGITEGAIYRHFNSKDQIVLELFKQYSSELSERIERAVNSQQNSEEQFRSVVEQFLTFAFNNPDAFKFINIFHYLRSSEVGKFRRLPAGVIRKFLEDLKGKGLLIEDTDFALAVLIGTLERVFLYKTMGILRGRRKEIINRTSENLWNYLVKCGKS